MYYRGSKARHAAEIIRVATAKRGPGQHWVEPFVGGGNVICRVPRDQGPRIGSDKNQYMIALLDAVGNRGWLPPETMTEAEWKKIKKNPDAYPPELVAFAATGPTFGSKWFDVWARRKDNYYDYVACARNAIIAEQPLLKGVIFKVSSYTDLTVPPTSILYCDPPYAGTGSDDYAGYKGSQVRIAVGEPLSKNVWNRNRFWQWADRMVDEGHQVYVSEYNGPHPSSYRVSSRELIDEYRALCILGKNFDERNRNPDLRLRPSPAEREELLARRRMLDAAENDERARLAARWQVVWSKKVVSDFSSQRGTKDEGTVKEETELLFHRTP